MRRLTGYLVMEERADAVETLEHPGAQIKVLPAPSCLALQNLSNLNAAVVVLGLVTPLHASCSSIAAPASLHIPFGCNAFSIVNNSMSARLMSLMWGAAWLRCVLPANGRLHVTSVLLCGYVL